MKYSLAIVAMVVFGMAASAMADGNVSQSQLEDFGLAGMTEMTDAQASEVRGQGFAFASSVSVSGVPGAFNVSPAVALDFNEALAISASSSEFEAEGFILGVAPFGGFFATFGISGSASSSGFAYAAAN